MNSLFRHTLLRKAGSERIQTGRAYKLLQLKRQSNSRSLPASRPPSSSCSFWARSLCVYYYSALHIPPATLTAAAGKAKRRHDTALRQVINPSAAAGLALLVPPKEQNAPSEHQNPLTDHQRTTTNDYHQPSKQVLLRPTAWICRTVPPPHYILTLILILTFTPTSLFSTIHIEVRPESRARRLLLPF